MEIELGPRFFELPFRFHTSPFLVFLLFNTYIYISSPRQFRLILPNTFKEEEEENPLPST